jgi:hypothetical protein
MNAATFRLWMIEAGLWEASRRKARHRKARPRRKSFGELNVELIQAHSPKTLTRTVTNDFTIRPENQRWQLRKAGPRNAPGLKTAKPRSTRAASQPAPSSP